MTDLTQIEKLAKLIRYYILLSTTTAGSGHPSSSLSAADLLATLMFGGFYRFDLENPDNPANDRLIFSKGHASPLFYALYLAAGKITPSEMLNLRKFDSNLEGHPTPRFKYTEAATGSLGQGLSVGVGMSLAINSKFQNSNSKSKVFVLLGDSEVAEGSVWEAANLAGFRKLDNLVAILDVNKFGQSNEAMFGWDTENYRKKFEAFGWDAAVIDGHDLGQIENAFKEAQQQKGRGKPFVIIAKTVKGKGVPSIEDKPGWHGKPIPKDQIEAVLKGLGEVDLNIRGEVEKPSIQIPNSNIQIPNKSQTPNYKLGDSVATRKAYGTALARLGDQYPEVVALDGETKNSTMAEIFEAKYPQRYFEMYIAEQNMIGAAVGFARLGFVPFASSFAAFFTRAYDQIRMARLGDANIKICGSHAGVSIGEDGPSQMGLEDIAMFRAINDSTILYPSDAVTTEKLVEEMIKKKGICYLRTSRGNTPVIYGNDEQFPIGGSKIHKTKFQIPNSKFQILIIAAGITLFEALKAQDELVKENIDATVLDCYSVKPIDEKTVKELGEQIGTVITVEDHWSEGGLGDAVLNVFAESGKVKVHKLAVSKMPRSGKPAELLSYEGIDTVSIINKVKEINK